MADLKKNIFSKEMILKNLTWVSEAAKKKAKKNADLRVKIRYRHSMASCVLGSNGGQNVVKFRKPQKAVTPGQYAVFYSGDEGLGRGKIVAAY